MVFDVVSQAAEFAGGGGPVHERAVQAQDSPEARVDVYALLPHGSFGVVEGVVGHIDTGDAGVFKDHVGVFFRCF